VKHPVRRAIASALPLAPGIVPLGVVFGATAVDAGLSVTGAVGTSALVFAGAAQFAAVGLLLQGASALAAIVFVINARYLLLWAATLELGRREALVILRATNTGVG